MPDDDENFETIIGHDGKRVRVLRDGKRSRVRMMMRDSDGRTVIASRISDGTSDSLALHRPGYRVHNPRFTAAMNDIKESARDAYERDLVDAWKSPLSNGDDTIGEGEEGSVCTVRNEKYPLDFGALGHVRNGVCVPDNPRSSSWSGDDPDDPEGMNGDSAPRHDARSTAQIARDHQQRMNRLHAQRDAELSQMWRVGK